MPLVEAACPNCGAALKVDSSKDAAICPYCGSAYVVEKAIKNIIGNNYGEIHADVVNIYGGEYQPRHVASASRVNRNPIVPDPEVIAGVKLAKQFEGAIQNGLMLKSDGTLGVLYYNSYLQFTDLQIFLWRNLKKFIVLPPKWQTGVESSDMVVVGLTFDGRCLVSNHLSGEYVEAENWNNIVDIAFNHSTGQLFGVSKDGNVHSCKCVDSIDTWEGIETIRYDPRSISVVALASDGRVFTTNSKDYVREAMTSWKEIVEVRGNYGLKNDGTVVSLPDDGIDVSHLKNVLTIHGGDAISEDGSIFPLYPFRGASYGLSDLQSEYIQSSDPSFWFPGADDPDKYFLTKNGRVDYGTRTYIGTNTISVVLHWIENHREAIFVHGDGLLSRNCDSESENWRIFIGNPENYGRILSKKVPDICTAEVLLHIIKSDESEVQKYMYDIEQLKNLSWRKQEVKTLKRQYEIAKQRFRGKKHEIEDIISQLVIM